MKYIDRYLFLKIHGLAGKSKFFDSCGIFCAKYLMYVFLVGCWLFLFLKAGAGIDYFFRPLGIALFARFVIAGAIHLLFPRERPFVVLQFKPLVRERILWQNASFPSGHTTFLFAFITSLVFIYPAAGWLYALGGLVGLGRIFAGVHWPSDIAAGALIGIVTGLASHLYFLRFFS